MTNKAILSVCGRDFKVLEFHIDLFQQSDNQGRPASGVFLGDFFFILQGGSDLFFEWISEPNRMESGVLKTYRFDQDSTFVEYSFTQSYLTTILENYFHIDTMQNSFNQVSTIDDTDENFGRWVKVITNTKSNEIGINPLDSSLGKTRKFQQRTGIPYVLMITLSCENITIRDIEHKNKWGK
ncbi:MAG: hypothetical protein LH606_20395 [Cytophagaceae bacterium]|nr:hypothetical protein [Cytophagaceae bacterium]